MRLLATLIVLVGLALPIRGADCPCGPECICNPCECQVVAEKKAPTPALPAGPEIKMPPVTIQGSLVNLTVPDHGLRHAAWIVGMCIAGGFVLSAVVGRLGR